MAVQELQNLYVELNSYVTNYFDTLDVQEEINKKLDEMAQDGSLTELISKYVNPLIDAQNKQIENLNTRVNSLSTLQEGSTTGDAEITDARAGYNGYNYSNLGNSIRGQNEWNKFTEKNVNLLTDEFNIYPIKALKDWNKYFPVASELNEITFLNNGGMIANLRNHSQNSSLNVVLDSTIVNKLLSINFDLTVNEIVGDTANLFNIVLNNTINLKSIYLEQYEIGKKYRINVNIPMSQAYNIAILFLSNMNITIENVSLTSPITKDFLKYSEITFDTLKDRLNEGDNINRNLPINVNQLVSNAYDIIGLYKLDNWSKNIPTAQSNNIKFEGLGVIANIDNFSSNFTIYKTNIPANKRNLTIQFDLTVLSYGNGNEIFNIVKNLSTNLKTTNTSQLPLNTPTTISIPCNNNDDLIRIDILFNSNLHAKIDNFRIFTTIEPFNINAQLDNIELVLPSKIPCGINYETNIYYDNILLNSYLENIQAVIPGSYFGNTANSQKDRLRIYQNNTQASQQYLSLRTKDNSVSKNNYAYQLIPLNNNVANNKSKKILIIGDSLTQAGTYQTECERMLKQAGFTAEYLGTRGTSPLNNEGRGGWSLKEYCNNNEYNGVNNPFYNNGFDFSYYMNNQGYSSVDFVFLNMGTNDMRNTNEETLNYYDTIIKSIKAFNNNISVFIGIAPPLSSIDRMEMGFFPRNKKLELARSLMSKYQNRENEKYFIVPFYLNFDAKTQFSTTKFEFNRYESGSTELVTDNTHPTTSGYYRMADTMFYSILYALSLE